MTAPQYKTFIQIQHHFLVVNKHGKLVVMLYLDDNINGKVNYFW
jgi:hypothetical protein